MTRVVKIAAVVAVTLSIRHPVDRTRVSIGEERQRRIAGKSDFKTNILF